MFELLTLQNSRQDVEHSLYFHSLFGPAIPRFAKVRHRQLAVKWAFGRFPPISSTSLEEKFGDTASRHLGILQGKLAGYHLNEEERLEIETALDQQLCMTITFFDDME